MIAQYKGSLSNPLSTIPQNAVSLIRNTSRGTLWALIIFGGTYFFMTEWENVREGLIHIAPEAYRPDIRKLYSQIRQVWMAYLRGQLTLMIIVAITFIIVWTAIGLPGSLYLGLLAGLFSIVPDVGPSGRHCAGTGCCAAGRFHWMPVNNFIFGLIVVGLYMVLINIENLWLRPYILGTQRPYERSDYFYCDYCRLDFLRDPGRVYHCAGIGFPRCDLELSARWMLGLPPFLDEVPAAPVPDPERSDESKAESAPAHPAAKKKSAK